MTPTQHRALRNALQFLEELGNNYWGDRKQIVADLRAALNEGKGPCDMGAMCLDCQPRGPSGECPDAPFARQWQGLTLDEQSAAWASSKGDWMFRLLPFAMEIERRLKEKNA